MRILELEDDWDGEGSPKPSRDVVLSLVELETKIRAITGYEGDIYPLPGDEVCLEYQHHDGVIVRVISREPGKGMTMKTFPDVIPAVFGEVEWKS